MDAEPDQTAVERQAALRRFVAEWGGARWLAAAIAVAVGCSALLVAQNPQPSDDAYITFRHVRNLLQSGRPVWNVDGDSVLGSTAPGYLLGLASFCYVFGLHDIPRAALYLNAGFHFLVVLLAYMTMHHYLRSAPKSLLVAVLVGVNAVNVYIASQGFESEMYLVILLASLLALSRGCSGLAVVLASVAPLVRPEGLLAMLMVWAALIWRRRFSVKLLAMTLIVPLGWAVVGAGYYGSPVPHSIVAKKQFHAIYQPYLAEAPGVLARLGEWPAEFASLARSPAGPLVVLGTATFDETTQWAWFSGAIVMLSVPIALATLCAARRGWTYALYPVLFLALLAMLGHSKPWYFPSFVVPAILSLFLGWMRAIQFLRKRLCGRRWARFEWWLSHALTGAVFLGFLAVNDYRVNRGEFDHAHRGPLFPLCPWGPLADLWEVQRYTHYRAAAEYLNAHAPPGSSVLASEVGVLGYHYDGPIIDAVGLCSPEALPYYPPPSWDIFDESGNYHTQTANFVPTLMVQGLQPDYLVNSRAYIRNLLRSGSRFLEEYELIAEFGRIWGEPLTVYCRRAPSE